MSMYQQFETAPNLEEGGVYLDYGDFRILIARAGGANKKYLPYVEKVTRPFRRAIQSGTLTEKKSRSLMYDIFAKTVILDWQVSEEKDGVSTWKQGIPGKDGEVLPYRPENVIQTFENLPALFEDIQKSAESINLFRTAEMEEDAKNL